KAWSMGVGRKNGIWGTPGRAPGSWGIGPLGQPRKYAMGGRSAGLARAARAARSAAAEVSFRSLWLWAFSYRPGGGEAGGTPRPPLPPNCPDGRTERPYLPGPHGLLPFRTAPLRLTVRYPRSCSPLARDRKSAV